MRSSSDTEAAGMQGCLYTSKWLFWIPSDATVHVHCSMRHRKVLCLVENITAKNEPRVVEELYPDFLLRSTTIAAGVMPPGMTIQEILPRAFRAFCKFDSSPVSMYARPSKRRVRDCTTTWWNTQCDKTVKLRVVLSLPKTVSYLLCAMM